MMGGRRILAVAAGAAAVLAGALVLIGFSGGSAAAAPTVELPSPTAVFDYQIGGDYPLPAGVNSVSRDWFSGEPAAGAYSVCYVNAFQTQANEPDAVRPDEQSAWPPS